MDRNSIVVGDTRELMKQLPDRSVNCIFTSPPYYNLRDYGADGQIGLELSVNEYIDQLCIVFTESKRVLTDDGSLWVNIGDSFCSGGAVDNTEYLRRHPEKDCRQLRIVRRAKDPNRVPKEKIGIPYILRIAINNIGFISRQDIVWNKPAANPFTGTDRFRCEHEYLFHFVKRIPYYFDHSIGRLRKYSDWSNSKDGVLIGDVWHIPQTKNTDHIATFPESLVRVPILSTCPIDGLVLDPFIGSGTTAVVAAKNGMDYLGFEINKEFALLAEKKLDNLGLKMF